MTAKLARSSRYVGPEVNYIHEQLKTFFSLRCRVDVGAVNRAQGHNIVFTLTKVF